MNRRALPSKKMLMLTGIALLVFGVLLLVSPVAVGAAVVRLVALILVIIGVVQLVQAFRARGATETVTSGLLGAIVAGLGVMVWFNPELGSGFLTALLMIFFIVHGLWKASLAFRFRGAPGWIWLLLSGLLSLLFVYLLWRQWPLSGAWAIGVLVGLDLLLTGLAMITLSVATRKTRSRGDVDTIRL